MIVIGNDLILGIDQNGDQIRLDIEARRQHLCVVGSTGVGKSKFVESLVRQDIVGWPKSGCGVALLDPDGKLFDDVMRFVAANDLRHWPIIPLDLRRFDTTIAYNPLRQRAGMEPAVVVAAVVEAILCGWNQASSNETPRLAKWLTSTLRLLYESNLTLVEALQLVSNPEIRKGMTRCVEDVVARAVWEAASHLKENEFQAEVESMMNRLRRFLSTQVIRASLCQTDISLDLSDVIERGSILLVSLATAGGRISDEDASTFGSLLLSDIWIAATTRGKRDGLRPFYVYADEFQRFMTPTVAENFDRARGYGVHYTVAHQFPSQLACRGESGKRVLQSVLANARTKVTFQMSHNDDLETLALLLCRQAIDPDRIKYQGSATRVIAHEIRYLPSFSATQSRSETNGVSASQSVGQNISHSANWSKNRTETDGVSVTHAKGDSVTNGGSLSRATTGTQSWSKSHHVGETESEATAISRNWADSTSDSYGSSQGTSRTTAVAHNLGNGVKGLDDDGRRKLGTNKLRPNYHALVNQKNGHGNCDAELNELTKGVSVSEALGTSDSKNHSRSTGASRGGSISLTHQRSRSTSDGSVFGASTASSLSETNSASATQNKSLSLGISENSSLGETYGESMSATESFAETVGSNYSTTESVSEGTTQSPHLIPILGEELSPPQFRSIDEQIFLWTKLIDALPPRHALVRIVDQPLPVVLKTRNLREPCTTRGWVERWTTRRLAEIPFALPLLEAVRRVAERQSAFAGFVERRQATRFPEPTSTRRKLRTL